MRKPILAALAALAFVVLPGGAQAQGEPCRPPGNFRPSTNLTIAVGQPGYARVSERQMASLARRQLGSGYRHAGLFTSQLNWAYGIKVIIEDDRRPGPKCTYLASADMQVTAGNLMIYIDQRFPPSSCAYRVTLSHEHQHYNHLVTALKRYEPTLQQALDYAIATAPPHRFADVEQAKSYYLSWVMRIVDPYFKHMSDTKDSWDQAIDTPQAYKQSQALCANW